MRQFSIIILAVLGLTCSNVVIAKQKEEISYPTQLTQEIVKKFQKELVKCSLFLAKDTKKDWWFEYVSIKTPEQSDMDNLKQYVEILERLFHKRKAETIIIITLDKDCYQLLSAITAKAVTRSKFDGYRRLTRETPLEGNPNQIVYEIEFYRHKR